MANLTPAAGYDNVPQLETTTPVLGGPAGPSNAQAQALLNRTEQLKVEVDTKAPIASPLFTGNPRGPTPAVGDNDTSLATTEFVQKAVGGVLELDVTGAASVTLTAVQAANPVLVFIGEITANINVVVPTARQWIVHNNTTGAFSLTVKTAAGSGEVVQSGKRDILYSDGVNVYRADTDHHSIELTGVPTAPTAVKGTKNTQIATTEFVSSATSSGGKFYYLAQI